MNRRSLQFTLIQAGLMACAVFMASLDHLPLLGILGYVVTGIAAVSARITPAKSDGLWKSAGAGTLISLGMALASLNRTTIDAYYALQAGQMALIVFLTANQPGADKTKLNWNRLGILWGAIGTTSLLGISYLDNRPAAFGLGLAAGIFLLLLCRLWFRPGALGIQVLNTLTLLLVLLPAADFVLRLKSRHDMSSDPAGFYSYESAKKNPGAFARWTHYYSEQWNRMAERVMMPDPNGFMPVRLRPGARAYFMHSLMSVNHRGFRGSEIADKKGDAYRIVALGESTTYGCTMNRGDRPWPELLEQMIRQRLHPARPVEVINAGIPAATLPGNLGRLTNEILALKPDMIISYHGYNAFNLLDKDLPPIIAEPAPRYEPRPSRLLADLEYALKLRRYKRSLNPKPVREHPVLLNPMASDYAEAYRRLIQIAQTKGIRLVLANYSMAVNTRSDPALIGFYEQTIPSVRNALAANLAHSEIVRELSQAHPEICFVDTHPDFDGRHQYFIDLMHFTQAGRQHLAETFFSGISKTLQADLAKSAAGNSN